MALTFSSTIIIVKLLSDKRELDELHGRIAVGVLIVQDIVVVLVMIGLTAAAGGGDQEIGAAAVLVLVKGILFLAGTPPSAASCSRTSSALARSHELLVLAAIAWAVGLATIGDFLGFSRDVGAFLGGVSLASTPYCEAIGSRLVTLRDFLLLFFFIDLGARVDLDHAGAQLFGAAVLSAFVLIGNPLIVMALMGLMGSRKRVGFLAGLTVAQISEFSLVQPRIPTGPRFTPREPPAGDVAGYVAGGAGSAMWRYHFRVWVHAPAEVVAHRLPPPVKVEPVDDRSCVMTAGSDTLDLAAVYIGMLDVDFDVIEPPEFVDHLRKLAARYLRAAGSEAGRRDRQQPTPDPPLS